ncbi:MAG TPA: chemotaxis protein CheX [Thermoclostridium caenicola]|uniref:chemotaxis protein CheX n=1 Tax=Thermoclostridium caenicola TaxID=659425 RepID=UPI002BCAC178|nr:chemotaxis protein CheX [Thermoclostridium caenicola]HOL85693.1 chemotaxis protein CheX [Thermoclostridium caenicola]HPO77993.1 chemotaxis protein CheX [Thermoclostridium caenicola]
MNVEYINPFIEASQSVLTMMTGNKPALGKVCLKKVPFQSDDIAVIVGLTGRIRGQVVISLSTGTALMVASAMMGGVALAELDEISKSAISELGNMIMGNTATILASRGIGIEITPPSLLVGQNMVITPAHMRTICVPLMLEGEKSIEINVSLEE